MSVSIVSTRASSWCIKTHDLTSSWCLFVPIFVSLMKIISRISQNDLHILHNGHICQTCKIIRVNIELAILAFILSTSGHANFECQQYLLGKKADCEGLIILFATVVSLLATIFVKILKLTFSTQIGRNCWTILTSFSFGSKVYPKIQTEDREVVSMGILKYGH